MKRVLLSLVLIGALGVVHDASASTISGFSGVYGPSFWTTTLTNCDGNVNEAGVPSSLTVIGCDNGSGDYGDISYTAVAAGSGTVSFAFSYGSTDPDAGYDHFNVPPERRPRVPRRYQRHLGQHLVRRCRWRCVRLQSR
jgi:hypothetical protein